MVEFVSAYLHLKCFFCSATPNSDHYWQNVNLSTPTTAPPTFSYSASTNKTKQPAARRRLNLNETSNFSHFNDDIQMHNIYQQPQQHNYPPVESGNLMHCLPRGIAPTFSPAHGTNKRVGKRKAPKSEPSEDGDYASGSMVNRNLAAGNNSTGSTRLDHSLLVTTRKFLNLKDQSGVLNLNEAANALGVPKRRLYDITNVLEGIDLVEKIGKNSIRWKSDDVDFGQMDVLQDELAALDCEETALDSLLHDVSSALKLTKEDPVDKPYSYVRYSEMRGLPHFENQILIAIKAPPDSSSSMEVADPVRTRLFQMVVRNKQRMPLSAYLCPAESHTCSSFEHCITDVDGNEDVKPLVGGIKEELSTSGPLHLPSHQSGHHLTLLESRRPVSGPSHYHLHSATAPTHSASSIAHSAPSNSSQHLPNSQLQDLTNANFVLPPTHSHGNLSASQLTADLITPGKYPYSGVYMSPLKVQSKKIF
ncbi:hypothetical protein WR25_26964 isoform B [Diploscapter pachys]|uniref:E2F/DP family winged-helix DNA-binding domain-containing protein n=1 Tax=Diploscapter pachys TaxID=2018661 RepID=A0A2A2JM46_9BILA|nr:hypothetical protein WR25_26964 isoform B [Diploscapter pachys]